MTRYLTREAILALPDIETEDVEVWGGTVRVRGLTEHERAHILDRLSSGKGGPQGAKPGGLFVLVAAATIVDEDGRRVFSEADVAALGSKSTGSINKVFNVAWRLSGLREEDAAEIEGNSPGVLSDASSSGSPSLSAVPSRSLSAG